MKSKTSAIATGILSLSAFACGNPSPYAGEKSAVAANPATSSNADGVVALRCSFSGIEVAKNPSNGELAKVNLSCSGKAYYTTIETFQYSGTQKEALSKLFKGTKLGETVNIRYAKGSGMYNYPDKVLKIQTQKTSLSFELQDWLIIDHI